jgi:hypothetical protein
MLAMSGSIPMVRSRTEENALELGHDDDGRLTLPRVSKNRFAIYSDAILNSAKAMHVSQQYMRYGLHH